MTGADARKKIGVVRVVKVPEWGFVAIRTRTYPLGNNNIDIFHGAALPDPARLLQGTGKFMRHVKLRPGSSTNPAELRRLIEAAYSDIKARVEHG